MTICYFGTYDPEYTRNKLNIQGLKENNVNVIECNVSQSSNKLKKYWALIKKHQKIKNEYDVMIVGFAGHAIMPLAWLLAKLNRKKIILDLFVSEYDSVILDRKSFKNYSPRALKYWFMDWLACSLADINLLDANEHIEYFVKTFKTKKNKFKRIFVSADENIFYPREKKEQNKNFLVHFHGSYSPIQGIEFIVKAAALLKKENIKFNIIGKPKNYKKEIELSKKIGANNINFINVVPYGELPNYISQADISLGFFGKTEKAFRCSAFKVVEAMAIKSPIITGDTPAMREILEDRENCFLCRMGDEKDLANKILELKNNPKLCKKITNSAYVFYKKFLTPKAVTLDLIKIIKGLK